MFAWISSLRSASAPAARPPARPPAAAPLAPPVAPEAAAAPPAPSALGWLLGLPPPVPRAALPAEREALRALDAVIAGPCAAAELLPRMPSVIPQLMALLRQDSPSRQAMAQQVRKDPQLTAEVLRLARSPWYGAQPVVDLEAALDRIGSSGLQSAMARLLLRPVFDAQRGGLLAVAAPRLWLHSEDKSMRCAEQAAQAGAERFEGSLAGLLHDAGWLALLRQLDRLGWTPEGALAQAVDAALDRRKDRLFGRLAQQWDLSPGLTALARHLADPRQPSTPLADALRAADGAATAALAGA